MRHPFQFQPGFLFTLFFFIFILSLFFFFTFPVPFCVPRSFHGRSRTAEVKGERAIINGVSGISSRESLEWLASDGVFLYFCLFCLSFFLSFFFTMAITGQEVRRCRSVEKEKKTFFSPKWKTKSRSAL